MTLFQEVWCEVLCVRSAVCEVLCLGVLPACCVFALRDRTIKLYATFQGRVGLLCASSRTCRTATREKTFRSACLPNSCRAVLHHTKNNAPSTEPFPLWFFAELRKQCVPISYATAGWNTYSKYWTKSAMHAVVKVVLSKTCGCIACDTLVTKPSESNVRCRTQNCRHLRETIT